MLYNSQFDGSRCVAVVTGIDRRSENPKTGPLVHVWFLSADHRPNTYEDYGICGDCPWSGDRGCYVRLSTCCTIWDRWARGGYTDISGILPEHTRQYVRYGAYGDPGSMHLTSWEQLHAALAPRAWTGYTHAWAEPRCRYLRQYLMASTTRRDDPIARADGWNTFMVVRTDKDAEKSIKVWKDYGTIDWCKADVYGLTCRKCMLCSGALRMSPGSTRTVVMVAHGRMAKRMVIA